MTRRPSPAAMPANSSSTARSALLKHLDRVYEMARVLAPTEKRASKLVEATYRRATQSDAPEPRAVRAWLLRLLLQTYATRRSDAATTSSVSTMRRSADLLQDFRRQTAEDVLRRAVPVAFALRSPREQLVLTLCDIVALDVEEAAVVLDTDPAALRDETDAAREALWTAVRGELSAGEQTLVEEELPDGALQDALNRVVSPQLGPLPPTLRPAVSAIMEQAPQQEPPPEASATGSDASDRADVSPPTGSPSSSLGAGRSGGTGASWGHRIRRAALAVVFIVATGLGGYALSSYLAAPSAPPSTDLIQLSAQQAEAVRPNLETPSAAEAERFVAEQLGRRIAVPRIDSATLRGVSIVEMDAGVQVPAFVFSDVPSNQTITTYAYTYAMIDRFGDRVQLTRDVRQELQDERRINLHAADDRGVLVWRVRDDIYVAVTKADVRRMRARIGSS